MGDVPLAAVVRPVAGRRGTSRPSWAPSRVEPRHERIARLLGQAVGVGDAVQRRVLPGEQRRPAREARGRPGIVAVQLHAGGAQALAGRELRAPELGEGLRLVGGRVALLVGHDHQDVGTSCGHRSSPRQAETRESTTHVRRHDDTAAAPPHTTGALDGHVRPGPRFPTRRMVLGTAHARARAARPPRRGARSSV